MLTISEAFDKFRHRLQTTPTEDQAAGRRQREIRELLDSAFDIDRDFLTGSYKRHTKIKPLRDVDIMVVLADRDYLDRPPAHVLADVRTALVPSYGRNRVQTDRRAVRVDFGVKLVDDLSGDVMSFDVVPVFADDGHYIIPDDVLGDWIVTDPEVHAELATAANTAYAEQWKPLVKMIKVWNAHKGKPLEPSFLIEVMALDILTTWGGDRPRELREFFATARDRVAESWPDPADLGPDVSDTLHTKPGVLDSARAALRAAEQSCTEALRLERQGRVGDALATWQNLFGPTFAKS